MATVYEAEVKYRADTGSLVASTNALRPMIVSKLSAAGTAAGSAFARGFGVAAKAGLAALATGGALAIVTAKAAIDAAVEQQAAEKKLAAVLRATGGAAGFTSRQLSDYAGELQSATTFSDDAIISSMSLLATFKNVSGDVFKQTVAAGLDLSEVFGSDLNSSILMLGKALQDPARGLLALSRAGVTFSASQKAMIKTLVESGQLLKAQKIILAEVTGQVGGAARAAVDTYAGAWKNLKNQLGETSEAIGFALLRSLKELGPLIQTAADGAMILGQQLAGALEGGKVDVRGINDLLADSIAFVATLGDQWELLGHRIAAVGLQIAQALNPTIQGAGGSLLEKLLEQYSNFLDKHGPGAGTPQGDALSRQRREFMDSLRQTNQGLAAEARRGEAGPLAGLQQALNEMAKNLGQDAGAIADRVKKRSEEIRGRLNELRENRAGNPMARGPNGRRPIDDMLADAMARRRVPQQAGMSLPFDPIGALGGLNRMLGGARRGPGSSDRRRGPADDALAEALAARRTNKAGGLVGAIAGKAGELLGQVGVAKVKAADAVGRGFGGMFGPDEKPRVPARFESLSGLGRGIQERLGTKKDEQKEISKAAVETAKVLKEKIAVHTAETAAGVTRIAENLGFGE